MEEGDNEGVLRVNLKRVFQEEGLLGYDPSLGTCTGETARGMLILRIQCLSIFSAVNGYVISCVCAALLFFLILHFVRGKSRLCDKHFNND